MAEGGHLIPHGGDPLDLERSENDREERYRIGELAEQGVEVRCRVRGGLRDR